MRSYLWLVMAVLACGPVSAQEPPFQVPSTPGASPVKDAAPSALPVSVDRIRAALELQSSRSLFSALPTEQPTFRIAVTERNRLQEFISTLDFRSGPAPAGGLYTAEQQRVMWPTTNYPLQQPYAAFSQSELLTVAIENLAGKYLLGRMMSAITGADRARALAAAREEMRQNIADYCAAQPNAGAGITICTTPATQTPATQ